MAPYNPKRPTFPVPIPRQAACLRFAAVEHGLGYWSYLARYADNPSYKLPDAWSWFDIPEALFAAAETMALFGELAELHGDEKVMASLKAAVERARAEKGKPSS